MHDEFGYLGGPDDQWQTAISNNLLQPFAKAEDITPSLGDSRPGATFPPGAIAAPQPHPSNHTTVRCTNPHDVMLIPTPTPSPRRAPSTPTQRR